MLLLKENFCGFCNYITNIKVYTKTTDGELKANWITATKSNMGWKGLVEIIQWGSVGLTYLDYGFADAEELYKIQNTAFSWGTTNASHCFENCKSLKDLPEHFSLLNNLKDISYMFSGTRTY